MPLSTGLLNARLHQTARHLEHWGVVRAHDDGATRGRRLLEFELIAPGEDLRPEVRALFREYYDRDRSGDWDLVKYTYDYVDLGRSWRLAYHFHAVGASAPIAHAHCERSLAFTTVETAKHFRAVEYDLREANAAFMRLYAAGRPPDCDDLLPLEVDRG